MRFSLILPVLILLCFLSLTGAGGLSPAPTVTAAEGLSEVRTPTPPVIEHDFATQRLRWLGQVILESTDEVLGYPIVSQDGNWFIISRTPKGNETNAYSELWRYDGATATWTQLTQNGVEELNVALNADGAGLTFTANGAVHTIATSSLTTDLSLTTPFAPVTVTPASAGFAHVPPSIIRVQHDASRNNCRPGVPDGRIDEIPFEEYVKRVVPHEVPATWPADSLRAQAVAVRTYGWKKILDNPTAAWHVTDSTLYQYMCDSTHPATNAAVDGTTGQHLTYNGTLITAMFSAENASPTAQNRYGHYYLSAVDDPLAFGQLRRGHGQGYSQWGGKRLADAGWRYTEILLHYYTDARLEPAAGDSAIVLDARNHPPTPYLRGSGINLNLNANSVNATEARTWQNDGSGWQISEWASDSDGSNGYSHYFSIADFPELSQDNFRVEYRSDAGINDLPVLFLGIDRTAPTLSATLTPTMPLTVNVPTTVTLALESDDALSGLAFTGYSRSEWQQEAETVDNSLPIVADPTASGGAAVAFDPDADPAQTVSFAPLPVTAQSYRLWFRLFTDGRDPNTVATLRVFDDATTPLQRGVRYLAGSDFPSGAGWAWFYVDVDASSRYTSNSYATATLTPQVQWYGTEPLAIDRVVLATRDTTPPPHLTVRGPEPVTLYAADTAGNSAWLTCTATPATAPSATAPSAAPNGGFTLYLPIIHGAVRTTDTYTYECDR